MSWASRARVGCDLVSALERRALRKSEPACSKKFRPAPIPVNHARGPDRSPVRLQQPCSTAHAAREMPSPGLRWPGPHRTGASGASASVARGDRRSQSTPWRSHSWIDENARFAARAQLRPGRRIRPSPPAPRNSLPGHRVCLCGVCVCPCPCVRQQVRPVAAGPWARPCVLREDRTQARGASTAV